MSGGPKEIKEGIFAPIRKLRPERFCPTCDKRLSEGNPNRYCFAHAREGFLIDQKELEKEKGKRRRKAQKAYNKRKKDEKNANSLLHKTTA